MADRLSIKEMDCHSHGSVRLICSLFVKVEMGHNSISLRGKNSFSFYSSLKLIQEFRREV